MQGLRLEGKPLRAGGAHILPFPFLFSSYFLSYYPKKLGRH